ncbi:MAG: PAS domain-containing protein [Deltaproteobacteria bacterium]|nr:PAS domain-containing protein [Deltaproteobacteria bacterium]
MPSELHERSEAADARALAPYLPVLFDGVEAGVLVVDRDHRIVLCNRFIQRWTKREMQDLIGHTCHRVLLGREDPCPSCPTETAFRTGVQATTRRTGFDEKGRPVHLSLTSHPIKNDRDEVVFAIEQARDESATVREKASLEESLRDATRRYQTVVDHCHDAIWILDRKGSFVWFNDRARKLAGGTLADRIGRPLSAELFSPGDLTRVQRIFAETLAGHEQSYEVRVRTDDGRDLDIAVKTSPILTGDEVVGTVSFGEDVTRRKRAETELVTRNEELEILNAVSAAVNGSLDLGVVLEEALDAILRVTGLEPVGGIFLVGDGGKMELAAHRGIREEQSAKERCLEVCERLCREASASSEVVIARDCCEDPACPPAISRILVPLQSHGRIHGVMFLFPPDELPPGHFDRRLLAALGGQIGVAIENARLYRATDEDLKRKVGELTASLEEVERQRENACEAKRMQEELLALISHDLRAPLGVIAWQADRLCQQAATDPAWHKATGAILRNAGRMTAMIADLVESARLESGQLVLAEDVLSMADLVIELVEALPADDRERILLEVAPAVRAVRADRDRMERAVMNLLANALKYSPPESHITVGVGEEAGSVRVRVEDRGPGIAEEDLPRIFDRYFRAAAQRGGGSPPALDNGLGLGLYISRLIVEAHGGSVSVSSVPGQGSSFWISLPVWLPPGPQPPVAGA